MDKNVHKGHRARLRQNMSKLDFEQLQQHQVLEYLLSFVVARKDTNPIAHNLINHFGSFSAVLEAPANELMSVKGVGEVTAVFLHEFLNFYNYYVNNRSKRITVITNPMTALFYAKQLLSNQLVELFYVVLLDSQGAVLNTRKMGKGTKSSINVQIRDITKYALEHNAAQIFICHNHPDTDSTPSAEDLVFTEELTKALEPIGIKMSEHIIVGVDDCYSFKSGYKITSDMIKEYNQSR